MGMCLQARLLVAHALLCIELDGSDALRDIVAASWKVGVEANPVTFEGIAQQTVGHTCRAPHCSQHTARSWLER